MLKIFALLMIALFFFSLTTKIFDKEQKLSKLDIIVTVVLILTIFKIIF